MRTQNTLTLQDAIGFLSTSSIMKYVEYTNHKVYTIFCDTNKVRNVYDVEIRNKRISIQHEVIGEYDKEKSRWTKTLSVSVNELPNKRGLKAFIDSVNALVEPAVKASYYKRQCYTLYVKRGVIY